MATYSEVRIDLVIVDVAGHVFDFRVEFSHRAYCRGIGVQSSHGGEWVSLLRFLLQLRGPTTPWKVLCVAAAGQTAREGPLLELPNWRSIDGPQQGGHC